VKRFATESERLEAFSDGVLAVIITIMVLDLRAPDGASLAALGASAPTFLAYVLSFIFVGIYWNNHHHMLRASVGIDGASMWANLHLLFWLSVVPFGTAWLGKYPNAAVPAALYGFNLLMCAVAYTILQQLLLSLNGPDTRFARALRVDVKGRLSLALYVCSIALAFVYPLAAEALFVVVAIIWVVPDRRFEPAIAISTGTEPAAPATEKER
jgi:uncharacterized membrane protein